MRNFILLFRQPSYDYSKTSPEEIKATVRKWKEWTSSIAAQGKFTTHGRLGFDGKVLKASGVVTDGPFVEIRERLGGFFLVKAESLEDATTLAHGCPAIDAGGSVEVREVFDR